jgi:hypothetical protein
MSSGTRASLTIGNGTYLIWIGSGEVDRSKSLSDQRSSLPRSKPPRIDQKDTGATNYEKDGYPFVPGNFTGRSRSRSHACTLPCSILSTTNESGGDSLGWSKHAVGLLQRRLVSERHPILLFRSQIWLGPVLCLPFRLHRTTQ